MIGGLALLVAAAGAVTAGDSWSDGRDTTSSGQLSQGSYVASLSSASLAGRNATQLSRSGTRIAASNVKLLDAAQASAAARNDKLRDTADEAEDYAEELESNMWLPPTSSFRYSTPFGVAGPYWASGYHTGADLSAPYGQPVVAPTNGVISAAGWDGAYGFQVRLRLDNGDEIWLNHMSSIDVTAGQSVVRGQQVGRVGATGNVSSPTAYHIHLEYRLASDLDHGVDPIPYFAEHGVAF